MKRISVIILILLSAASCTAAPATDVSPVELSKLRADENVLTLQDNCENQASQSGLGASPGTILYFAHFNRALNHCLVVVVAVGPEGQYVDMYDLSNSEKILLNCFESWTPITNKCEDDLEHPVSPEELSSYMNKYLEIGAPGDLSPGAPSPAAVGSPINSSGLSPSQ